MTRYVRYPAACLLLLWAASPAAAQIRPCNPTGEPGIKVFLDDLGCVLKLFHLRFS